MARLPSVDPRVVLLSGATGGIGRALASQFAARGDSLMLTARSRSRLDCLAASLQADGNVAISCVEGDLTVEADVQRVVATTLDRFGRIDVLVNNAGIGGGGRTVAQSTCEWQTIVATNLTSVFLMTREVLRSSGMIERRWGRIVNIASTAGKQGVVFGAAYTASKHGVVGLTKSLGIELAATGVTVNAVCPGFVDTDLATAARERYAELWSIDEGAVRQRQEQRVPLGRYLVPDEVAPLVVFLASREADAIVGQALNVCGGLGNF